MRITVLIFLFVLINQYFMLDIKPVNGYQDIAEFQWEQEIESTWKTLSENRQKKYILLEVQGNPSVVEINRLDNNIRMLESKLEMLINDGINHKYHTTVIDIFPDRSIRFPGIPKGEEVIDNTGIKVQQNNENSIENTQTGIKRGAAVLIVNPTYPSELKENLVDDVKIAVTINKVGKVVNAKCISGNSKLFNFALSAISKWRFQPYTKDTKPINVVVAITLTFKK